MTMQAKKPSPAITMWVVTAAVAPVGGLFAKPLGIIGAIFVLFSLLIAGVECQR
ncbi:MAG TPA: hypothetical protein VFQ53_13985 [Kofleriaceae bacterium]|nr:hypothetical protein [Kofleriaceae bacterium]